MLQEVSDVLIAWHDIHMRNSFTSFPKGEFSINSPLLYAYFGLVVLAAVMSYPIAMLWSGYSRVYIFGAYYQVQLNYSNKITYFSGQSPWRWFRIDYATCFTCPKSGRQFPTSYVEILCKSFCWYWCNCWLSLFKLSFHNITHLFTKLNVG